MILTYVTTVPESFNFFRGQISYMKERGFEVHVVSSGGESLNRVGLREKISVHGIDIPRSISPVEDLRALRGLRRLFKSLKPTIVHANFPKGGILGVLAARLAQVPVVIYGMRGLRFDTETGLKGKVLYSTEALACRLAHQVICNSFSIRQRVIDLRLCQAGKIRVLAGGSSNGVDAAGRFNPQRVPIAVAGKVRDRYQIPKDCGVLGFVGRIVRDKGIVELEAAWQDLRAEFPNLYLILVGPIEPHDPVPPQVLARLEADSRVRFTGSVGDTAPFYAMMDLLVLPTHREGFPNTPLEAAAMEVPVVATGVDGCLEAVVDGVTGLLVPPRHSWALARAIQQLLLHPEMRRQMGQAGRARVMRDFRPEMIWQALYENYLELLNLKFNSSKNPAMGQ